MWAAKYIGKDYLHVGMCWGLVQLCCIERHGVAMPEVQSGERHLRDAAKRCGWLRSLTLYPDCIAVMSGTEGRHVAYSLQADGVLQVLHATRAAGVEALPWGELARKGYHSFEFWRHAA